MDRSEWQTFRDKMCQTLGTRIGIPNLLELISNPFVAAPEPKLESAFRSQPLITPLSWSTQQARCGEWYLPIECLKGVKGLDYFLGQAPTRIFLSSGTTSADRSRSGFSDEGLSLYKLGSLAAFFAKLEELLGRDLQLYQGISLVPPVRDWPDSSLAQMIDWIGEYLPIRFLRPDEFSTFVKNRTGRGPIWVFGTAFHYVNLVDHGQATALPEGSVLIETGGTKGRSRDVLQDDYIDLLCQNFSVPSDRIISEYGMCELASQAYRIHTQLEPRGGGYRFPRWVSTYVTQGGGSFDHSGSGTLTIIDPLRIDYPWPIRTQDMVDLAPDGTFGLLGRVPHAALKGCSLMAEDILVAGRPAQMSRKTPPPMGGRSLPSSRVIKRFADQLRDFLRDPEFLAALSREIGCPHAGRKALADIKKSIPRSTSDWQQALDRSGVATGGDRKWCIIAPNSHPVASFYPLTMGALGQLDLSLRIPSNYSDQSSSLCRWVNFLNHALALSIRRLDASARVGGRNFPADIDSLLVFGSDDVIQGIRTHFSGEVIGFGSMIGVSIISGSCKMDMDRAIDDALALGQMGCLSTRAIIAGDTDPTGRTRIMESLRDAGRRYWNGELTLGQTCALDCEEIRLKAKGALVLPREKTSDMVISWTRADEMSALSAYLSPCQFALPIIDLGTSWDRLPDLLSKSGHLALTISDSLPSFAVEHLAKMKISQISPLGQGQVASWDGTLHGQPLFVFPHLS